MIDMIKTNMKKTNFLICCLLFLLLPLSCATINNTDFSLADDKLSHLSYSVGISAASAAYFRHERKEEPCRAATIGFGVSMSLGASKETYDKYIKKTHWDWGDIAWDFLGSSIGSLVGSGCH